MKIGRTLVVIEAAPLPMSRDERGAGADVRREVAARDPEGESDVAAESEHSTRLLEVTV